jgi:hypothetical protein
MTPVAKLPVAGLQVLSAAGSRWLDVRAPPRIKLDLQERTRGCHWQPSRGDYSHRTPESPESTTVTFAVAEAGLVGSLGRRARLDDGGAHLRLLSSPDTSTAPAIDLTGSRKFPVSEDSSLCLSKAASRAESMCGFWVASVGMPCRFFCRVRFSIRSEPGKADSASPLASPCCCWL